MTLPVTTPPICTTDAMPAQEHPVIIEATAFIELSRASIVAGLVQPRMPEQLYTLLGCAHVIGNGPRTSQHLQPCDQATLTARSLMLPKMFAAVGRNGLQLDRLAILTALNRFSCWSEILKDVALTYELAQAITDFIDCYSPALTNRAALSEVVSLLNNWLKPSTPWSTLPGIRTFGRHAFGEEWCTFVLPDEYADIEGKRTAHGSLSVSDFIAAQRPPFVKGLCPAQDEANRVNPDVALLLPCLVDSTY
jgi:hypothetical protein